MRFKKGQAYSIEMIFTVIIAIILLSVILSLFITLVKQSSTLNKQYITLWYDSDLLLGTRGFPSDWDEDVNKTKLIGIASDRNVIDQSKLNALMQIPDEDLSSLLRLDGYNVSVDILIDGNLYYQKGNVSENATVIQLQRSCMLSNGSPCILRIRYNKD
jgi:hypothetical protein